jgi:chromosome segregation ATPase
MDKFQSFISNNDRVIDPAFKEKLEQLNNFYEYAKSEVSRITALLNSKKDEESEFLKLKSSITTLANEHKSLLAKNDNLTIEIQNKNQMLVDIESDIVKKDAQNKKRDDLSVEISTLEKEKNEIIQFNRMNKIEKDDLEYVKKQTDLLKGHLLTLEQKKNDLTYQIKEKEKFAQRFDRDLEKPQRILQEIKDTELSVKTTHDATIALLEEEKKKPESIAAYIRKLQKKYPNIDFLNI